MLTSLKANHPQENCEAWVGLGGQLPPWRTWKNSASCGHWLRSFKDLCGHSSPVLRVDDVASNHNTKGGDQRWGLLILVRSEWQARGPELRGPADFHLLLLGDRQLEPLWASLLGGDQFAGGGGDSPKTLSAQCHLQKALMRSLVNTPFCLFLVFKSRSFGGKIERER